MMHRQLGKLNKEINKKFSGLNIIFSGDFQQLELVGRGKLPIYKDDCPYFIDWVNCYIELNGMHRFKKDMSWGKLLMRMWNRELTKEDVEFINTKVVTGKKSIHLPKTGMQLIWCCLKNIVQGLGVTMSVLGIH